MIDDNITCEDHMHTVEKELQKNRDTVSCKAST